VSSFGTHHLSFFLYIQPFFNKQNECSLYMAYCIVRERNYQVNLQHIVLPDINGVLKYGVSHKEIKAIERILSGQN
jgi:hypothetical protein